MPIGPLMIDIEGTSLTTQDQALIQNKYVGGVILFTRNYRDLEQLQALIYEIRHLRKEPILIAVDQEGGRVQRFQEGFTRLPAMAELGRQIDLDIDKGFKLTSLTGWLMAAELLSLGIDFSFAPVLDLNLNISKVIGDRSFHRHPEVVSALARSFVQGMHNAGMAAVGKHFPGHGSVSADSHAVIPIDERSSEEILQTDIIPFIQLIKYGIDAIMPAHIIYSQLDARPPTFSDFWLQHVLRQQAGFKGVIFSDDLSMAGAEVAGDYVERTVAALKAGCDMVLICNNRAAVLDVITALKGYHAPQSEQRLLKMCGHFQYTRTELVHDKLWLDTVVALNDFQSNETYPLKEA